MNGALGGQMSGSLRKAHALELFSGLSGRYGLMAALLSFGQDPRWRRTMVAAVRALWTVYTRVGLPALGRLVSRDWYEVGRFLGPSITEFYRRHPLDSLETLWREAGIAPVELRSMSVGGGIVIAGVKDGNAA